MSEDRSIQRVGGWAGILAGIFLILFPIGIALTGGGGDTEFLLSKLQEFGRFYAIVPALGMIAFLLSVPLFLALHRVSKKAGPATAVIGGALGVSGAVFAAVSWAITMAGFPVLSDLWAAAPAAQKETVLLVAQALELGVTHTLTGFGVLLIGLAFAALGIALRGRPDVPNGYGWVSLILGLLVVVSMATALALNESGVEGPFVILGLVFPIALFLLLGWKVYSLSRTA